MIEIQTAFDLYAARLESAGLWDWPEAYSVHFQGDKLLGELQTKVEDEAKAVFAMMVPFGFCVEVTDSFVFFEAHRAVDPYVALVDATRCVYVSRLSQDGAFWRTAHWIFDYSVRDDGTRVYSEPRMAPHFVPKVNEVLGSILDARLSKAVHSFDETVMVAMMHL